MKLLHSFSTSKSHFIYNITDDSRDYVFTTSVEESGFGGGVEKPDSVESPILVPNPFLFHFENISRALTFLVLFYLEWKD